MPLKVLNDSMFVKPCNFLNMDSTVKVKPDSESPCIKGFQNILCLTLYLSKQKSYSKIYKKFRNVPVLSEPSGTFT